MEKNVKNESVIKGLEKRITSDRDLALAKLLGQQNETRKTSPKQGFWYPGSGNYAPTKVIAGKV